MKKLIIPAVVLLAGAASAFTTNSTKNTLAPKVYRIDVPGVECSEVPVTCSDVPNAFCTTTAGSRLYKMNTGGTTCDVDQYKP